MVLCLELPKVPFLIFMTPFVSQISVKQRNINENAFSLFFLAHFASKKTFAHLQIARRGKKTQTLPRRVLAILLYYNRVV